MTLFYGDDTVTLHHGDALEVLRELPDGSADACVTSPPYFGLRDYGELGQYGLEDDPAAYVLTMRAVFAEVGRILADDGTLWLNLGDSYAGKANGGPSVGPGRGHSRPNVTPRRPNLTASAPYKSLLGIPWRVAFALQADGWIIRNEIIWNKPNAMPESVTDRLSTRHEHLFLLTRSPRYFFDLDSIREAYDGDRALSRRARSGDVNQPNSVRTSWPPVGGTTKREGRGRSRYGGTTYDDDGRPTRNPEEPANQAAALASGHLHTGHRGTHEGGRNPGDVWTLPTQPFAAAHFAVMPVALAERCVVAGCKPGGVVLDPFSGSGTTGLAAAKLGRRYVGVDLSREYLELSMRTRLGQGGLIEEAGA